MIAEGGVAVADHDRLEIHHHRVARRGFAADVGDGADDQHRIVALCTQTLGDVGRFRQEGAEAEFLDDLVFRFHLQIRIDVMARRAILEGFDALRLHRRLAHGEPVRPAFQIAFVDSVLDPEYLAAGLAERRRQLIDFRNRADRRRHGHRRVFGNHETVLQIDDDERRPAWHHVVEDVYFLAALLDAINGPLRHREFMHHVVSLV